jgi:hypothetical protein
LALGLACSAVVLASALWRYFARPTRAAGRTALSPLAVASSDGDSLDDSARQDPRQ